MVKVPQGTIGYAVNGKIVLEPRKIRQSMAPVETRKEQQLRKLRQSKERAKARRLRKNEETRKTKAYIRDRIGNAKLRALKFLPQMSDLKNASKKGDLVQVKAALEAIHQEPTDMARKARSKLGRWANNAGTETDTFDSMVRILFLPDVENRTAIYYAALCGHQHVAETYLSLLVIAHFRQYGNSTQKQIYGLGERTFLQWLRHTDFRRASLFDGEQLRLCVLSALNDATKNVFFKNLYSIDDMIRMAKPFMGQDVLMSVKPSKPSPKKPKRPALVCEDDSHSDYRYTYGHGGTSLGVMCTLDDISEDHDFDERYRMERSVSRDSGDDTIPAGKDETDPIANELGTIEYADELQVLVEEIERLELEEAIKLSSVTAPTDDALASADNHDDAGTDSQSYHIVDVGAVESIHSVSSRNRGIPSVTHSFSVVSFDDESWADASESAGIVPSMTDSWQMDGMSRISEFVDVKPRVADPLETSEVDTPSRTATTAFSYRDALLRNKSTAATTASKTTATQIGTAESTNIRFDRYRKSVEQDDSDEKLEADAEMIRDGAKFSAGGKASLRYKGNARSQRTKQLASDRKQKNNRQSKPWKR